jgi:hypothetical protein
MQTAKSQCLGIWYLKKFPIRVLFLFLIALPPPVSSAAYLPTTYGFLDLSSGIEWLNPNNVRSLVDYRAYQSVGWHVANIADFNTLPLSHYLPYSLPLLYSARNWLGPQQCSLSSSSLVSCPFGWVQYNYWGTVGQPQPYVYVSIGFGAANGQTSLLAIAQTKPGLAFFMPAVVSVSAYPLFGDGSFSPGYATFMIRPVPIPSPNLLLASGLLLLLSLAIDVEEVKARICTG